MTLPPGLQFERAEWVDQAACRGRGITALFFPERGTTTRQAKAVCAACPVRELCLEYALTTRQKFGIWGGLSERERRRVRRDRAMVSLGTLKRHQQLAEVYPIRRPA